MKKCKKVLAMLIVIVLTITIAGDLSIVYAEEAIQEMPGKQKGKSGKRTLQREMKHGSLN